MKLSGLKPGVSIRLSAESAEAENHEMQRLLPPQPAHSSPGLKARGFLRRRIKFKTKNEKP
jgi:hypothetical protein